MLNKQNTVVDNLRKSKDEAYRERNKLVAFVSTMFPSFLGKHEETDTTWHKEWMNIVYIELPTGQISWHLHDSDVDLFSHLEFDETKKWDGHSTEEKYDRLFNQGLSNLQ